MKTTSKRCTSLERVTDETQIKIRLNLDGKSEINVNTGIGLFDHILITLAFYAGWDLQLEAKGDTHIDDHHTIEDCGLALGNALATALGDRCDIARFGWVLAPHDESLARAVIDISNRPYVCLKLELQRDSIGALSCENVPHFLESLAHAAGITLHIDIIHGSNDHHKIEAAFKALGMALAQACTKNDSKIIKSTKGVI